MNLAEATPREFKEDFLRTRFLGFEETIRATGIATFTATLLIAGLLGAVVTTFERGNVGADVERSPFGFGDTAWWLLGTITVTVSIEWLPA